MNTKAKPRILTATVQQLDAGEIPEVTIPRVQKITNPTPAQEALLPEWRTEWQKVTRSTTPADRFLAEAAVRACYKLAKLPPPRVVLWGCDPLQATQLGIATAKRYSEKTQSWATHFGGQLWVGWYYGLASVSFLIDGCGLDLGPDLEFRHRVYSALARSCSWAWFSSDVCALAEKPRCFNVDNERLHCPTGPSIAWADGLELYHWRDTQVPKEWIMDRKSIPITAALTERNLELRNAAAQLIGWDRVLAEVGARVIDTDPNPEIGTLLECDLPDAPKSRFLQVRCATGRTFVLAVPNDVRTALEANASTYGVEGRDNLEAFAKYFVRT